MCHASRHQPGAGRARAAAEGAAEGGAEGGAEGAAARGAGPGRPDPGVRVSDAEREQVVRLLTEHGGAGRLTPDELAERVDAAFAARTRGELRALLGDLPPEPDPAAQRVRRRRRERPRFAHPAAAALLAVAVVVLAVAISPWFLFGLFAVKAAARGGGVRPVGGE